jgi:uncharacterized protein YjbI with pentapeptide repeats
MRFLIKLFFFLSSVLSQTVLAYEEDHLRQLLETNICIGCDLVGVDLSGKMLERADLSAANLAGARFTQTNLYEANLSGARLVAVQLTGVDLRFADLSGADLSRAILVGDIYLLGFYDERPDLRHANLRGANFSNALFYKVRLEDAIMDDSTIMPAGFPKSQHVSRPYQWLTTFEINTNCPPGMQQTYKGCEQKP